MTIKWHGTDEGDVLAENSAATFAVSYSEHFITIMEISQFYIAGINYKKTDAAARGQFAVNTEQYIALTRKAELFGITEFFVLSTCNRTEIYGLAHQSSDLVDLLCSETAGTKETFNQLSYNKNSFSFNTEKYFEWEFIE